MAYRKTRQKEVGFYDGDNKAIGGFSRADGDADQTTIGPIYSPDGTAHWIVVSNAGALTASTSKPPQWDRPALIPAKPRTRTARAAL